MLVSQVTPSNKPTIPVEPITQEQLQQEFYFIKAQKITQKLLSKGLITDEEYHLIMAENKVTFPTLLSPFI